ncbi:MAG: DUF4905 domain-containing protein [Bacteroidetes bacterium]|nr:DUF4905 domain-containing protein [Bacteroidota bacterium]MBU1761164.1 DUF4905 domain-containing protein [Bacteroidota bacterium]
MMLHKDTPKLLYSAQTNGIIWKIEVDDELGIMVWETRYPDKRLSFSAYDFINQKFLVNDAKLKDEFSISLSFTLKGLIFFQVQESENLPTFKGIIAFNLYTQKIQWENYSITIQQQAKEGILVFNPKIFPRNFELLNQENGQFIRKINLKDFSTLGVIHRDILLPEVILKEFENSSINLLNHKGLTIKSQLETHDDILKNSISILEGHQLIFKDYLNSNIQKLAFDTFFVWQDRLVYIKNKSEIVTYLV